MKLAEIFRSWLGRKPTPLHLRSGELGERAAKRYLQKAGLKHLVSNFRTKRGEIDLVFRDGSACNLFILEYNSQDG